jgi:hypothetical protein
VTGVRTRRWVGQDGRHEGPWRSEETGGLRMKQVAQRGTGAAAVRQDHVEAELAQLAVRRLAQPLEQRDRVPVFG